MKRESMVFYDSFFEAIKDLPPEEFKKCACGLLCYGLYGEVPETNGIEKTIYVLSKPLIDKNNQRWVYSKKKHSAKSAQDSFENEHKTDVCQNVCETSRDDCVNAETDTQQNESTEPAENKEPCVHKGREKSDVVTNDTSDKKMSGDTVLYEGVHKNVKLTVSEKCNIINRIGILKYIDCVKYYSEYLHNNPSYFSNNNVEEILTWVLKRVDTESPTG